MGGIAASHDVGICLTVGSRHQPQRCSSPVMLNDVKHLLPQQRLCVPTTTLPRQEILRKFSMTLKWGAKS